MTANVDITESYIDHIVDLLILAIFTLLEDFSISRRNATLCILAYSYRRHVRPYVRTCVCMCACVYVTLVDMTKTV